MSLRIFYSTSLKEKKVEMPKTKTKKDWKRFSAKKERRINKQIAREYMNI